MFISILVKISGYIMNIISDLFNEFGMYGPIIQIILSIYLLWDNHNHFFYYIIGIFTNSILNLILKGLLQQPRPSEDLKTFNLALTHGKIFLFKNGIPYDIFGMPSGHAQAAIFSTVFVYLCLRKTNILYIYLFLSFIIMAQRVAYNHHTVLQVSVGGIIGGIFGYYIYYLAQQMVKGKIREKPDDFGPV
jgi:membrane-associated phospholipid phosphatase